MCSGNSNCSQCTSCNNNNTAQISITPTNNAVQPTVEQLNEAQPFLMAVAQANPDAVTNILRQQGFTTQGMSAQGLGNFMYRMYAAGQFDINSLNGLRVGSLETGFGEKTVFSDNEDWTDWVGDISGIIGSVFGNNSGLAGNSQQIQQQQQQDNSNLIAGMQKNTMYMIAGIMMIVIALIVFLSLRKK